MRFGVFEVNLRAGELRKHGLRIRVPGQALRVLTILLDRPGEVITREELRNHLWPAETFVDFEHSVNSAIKKLREALSDSANNPRYIETVPRVGYRFIAPLTAPDETPPRPPEPEVSSPSVQVERFARPTTKSRALAIWAILAILGSAAFLAVTLRRNSRMPFEATTTVRLTSAGQIVKAAISPDSRYIAYTLNQSGEDSMRIRRSTELHDIEIVPAAPVHYLGITFSPDNESIYYVTHGAAPAPPVLYRVPALGGSVQKVKENLASPVTFSPDGKRYAFVRESASESILVVADLESGAEQTLIAHKLPQVLDYPAWSPDGQVIACTFVDASRSTPSGSEARIVRVRVRDGVETNLSSETWGFIRGIAWLGSGRGLLISARGHDSNVFHVWFVSYPDGAGRKVTEGLNHQVGVSLSSNSNQIVTVEQSMLSEIWRMSPAQEQDPDPVVSGVGVFSAPVGMRDGGLLFEKQLNGYQNIWLADASGTNQKQITLLGNNYAASIASDGRRLACISDRSGSPAIWTMDIDGSNPTMLATAFGDTVPNISPDGKWVAFTAISPARWKTLWLVPSRGGRPIELNRKIWVGPVFSPDSRAIAGFYADQQLSTNREPASIAVVGVEGGGPLKTIPIPLSVSVAAGIRWTLDGRQLTYVDRRDDADNIWTLPLNGGTARQVTHFHGGTLFGFDWSPDGKHLLLSRGIQARDVVLIKDAEPKSATAPSK